MWYHAENEEPWTIPSVDTSGMWFHGSNEFIVHSHIQDIPENGADIGRKIEIFFKKIVRIFSHSTSKECPWT